MCGIAGFIELKPGLSADELRADVGAMAGTLAHRGPDGDGVWVDAESGVALGHTRLAIIDLSPQGAQPMVSGCGRFVLSYNGEIYNAPELRRELEKLGRSFRGHSDTEVIVEGCAQWGVEPTVRRLIGMFAFAVWDRESRTVSLVRDRLGIKPLYWGRQNGRLVFASELKAIAALPGWRPELDRQALAAFMRLSYVPAPMSIYQDIQKLTPGAILEFSGDGEPTTKAFWTLDEAVAAGEREPLDLGDDEAASALDDLLCDAVGRRMVSDVPLGAFLSGGIDSSTVVALMQAASSTPIKSFSIGFNEDAYNEAVHAKAVAAHLGTDHTELYVSAEQARAVIPELPMIYDEPFADSSQIPTFLVSRMTREHVTVALSGDGGDELFAGYNRYLQGAAIARAMGLAPRAARQALASALVSLPPATWDRFFDLVPASRRPRLAGDKVHKLAGVLAEDDVGFYRELISQWDDAWKLVKGASREDEILDDKLLRQRFGGHVEWMQYLDTLTYLPDDILTKVDRASMAVSLEARVPMLDHRVVEFAWRLPKRMKIRDGQGKWLLRQVLARYVPKRLVERPKMGFGVPIDDWLRGPLKDWAEDLLDPVAMDREGWLESEPIQQKWREHQSGRRNWQYFLWNVLMFEAWRREAGL